jgi:RNA polymerase sigma-70 factor (ECF subfamily)
MAPRANQAPRLRAPGQPPPLPAGPPPARSPNPVPAAPPRAAPQSQAELTRELSALARTHRGALFALGLQLLGSAADAEDLVQDTLLRAHRSLPAFRGDCSLRTWLFRIAVNRALSNRQRRARAMGIPFDDERVHAAIAVDAAGDPHLTFELRERYALLLTALDRLSPSLRATVVLVTTQGLSLDEAAQILGCSPGTVGWRLHEARRQMQQQLAPVSGVRKVKR